jgi:prepilin-type N-terminal cleavage/methylation domain-containing protein
MIKSNKKGFTLIELLVVIAIIGILSSVVIASMNSARKKSRDARRISDISQIQTALEMFYDANQNYATSTSQLVPVYLPKLPTDPMGAAYFYASIGTGTTCSSYHLATALEEATNVALSNDADVAAGTVCTNGGTDFAGVDTGACGGTAGASMGSYCYDIKP